MTLSPLLSSFSRNGFLIMLALDHRGSFEKIMGVAEKTPQNISKLIETKSKLIRSLYPIFSGVLIDQEYGLPAYEIVNTEIPQSFQKPYLLCIEKTGYEEKDHERTTVLEYSVDQLVGKGAKGVKILLFFNPHAKNASVQLNTAKAVLEGCRKNNVPLFLELVTYPVEATEIPDENLVISSVEYFLERNVVPDVFKLEYPHNPDSCKKITILLKQTPWILLSKGEPFDDFRNHIKIAGQNGARGFLAGRSIWQEINQFTGSDLDTYLKDEVVSRFSQIAHIMTG